MNSVKKIIFLVFIILISLIFGIPFLGWELLYKFTPINDVIKNYIIQNNFILQENLLKNLYLVFNLIDYYFLFLTVYTTIIAIFGFKVKHVPKDLADKIIQQGYINNFVLLICAHNEEKIIANSLEEMIKTNYPRENLKIVVVCDNCTDNTYHEAYKIANKYPSTIFVLQRFDPNKKGKPFAVKFGLNWINENLKEFYTAISIADADNIYHRDFFKVMNYKIFSGSEIVQGYLGVKNPYDSFVSASGMYTYSILPRFYFTARQNLGMSTTLGGTGFVITKKTLEELKWDMKSLVEDFEFSTKAVIAGKKIDFAYDAVTYDEKPTTMEASIKQRSRWQQGHWNVAFRMTPKLIYKMIFQPTKIHWPSAFDYLLYLWSPGRIIIYIWFFTTFLLLLTSDFFSTNGNTVSNLFIISWEIRLFIILIPRILEYIYAILEGFLWYKIPQVIFFYTVFFAGWIPGSIKGLFTWPFQGNWDKTEHKVVANLESLEKISKPFS